MFGVMYIDTDKKKLFSEKVEECIMDYKKRMEKDALVVLVNVKDYDLRDTNTFSVPVRPDKIVLPNCFWVGEEKK